MMTALITGASAGIGAEYARQLAAPFAADQFLTPPRPLTGLAPRAAGPRHTGSS